MFYDKLINYLFIFILINLIYNFFYFNLIRVRNHILISLLFYFFLKLGNKDYNIKKIMFYADNYLEYIRIISKQNNNHLQIFKNSINEVSTPPTVTY